MLLMICYTSGIISGAIFLELAGVHNSWQLYFGMWGGGVCMYWFQVRPLQKKIKQAEEQKKVTR